MWIMAFRIAVRALGRNKLRSFLTMMGIIIGVGAVIAMVAIGEGAKALVRQQIASLGTNLLVILPGTVTVGGARTGAGGRQSLVDSDAKAVMSEIPVVTAASPVLRQVQQAIAGDQNWATSVQGVAPEFQQIRNWQVQEGRFISQADVDSTAKVALIGQTVAYNLFGDDDPLDNIIRIKKIPFRIIGVLGAKGQTGHGTDQDDVVMVPYTTMQKRIMGVTYVQQIIVSAVSADKTQEAKDQITLLLRQRHKIRPGADDDFNIRNLSDIAEAASNSATVMAVLLGSIASVSLLVGGIGIMNIMLVSVTERTREIGIRMAVGARSRDIMLQFIVEAVVMAAIGGALGILVGIGSSNMIQRIMEWPVLVRPDIVIIALLVSGGVGIFFGFYPAQKAAHLDPIDALRYE
ncbi:MAG: multidrug ABC transporter substrate-binding protein [Deltaproteobacteria bacterium RIFCSPLOWO2_02_56_12]|nr:MAG: multidrug ABC transporter substrate-binding protein [Deltaproteobacteria bacterium RIFCSPLOWO2_02_56_12]OGQ72623.1 MAG: multidrug ABC transporter substrate-binding protein [Deltaproteobacteria bacterium RIFCSPLOWO2_12_55_13]